MRDPSGRLPVIGLCPSRTLEACLESKKETSQIAHASDLSPSKLRLFLTFDQHDLSRSPTVLRNSTIVSSASWRKWASFDSRQRVGGPRGICHKLPQTAETTVEVLLRRHELLRCQSTSIPVSTKLVKSFVRFPLQPFSLHARILQAPAGCVMKIPTVVEVYEGGCQGYRGCSSVLVVNVRGAVELLQVRPLPYARRRRADSPQKNSTSMFVPACSNVAKTSARLWRACIG